MFNLLPDGSVQDESGKVVFLSCDRFVADVCLGNHCFVCGMLPKKTELTKEHIIPNWVLKFASIHNRTMKFPNSTTFPYRSYVVPCCRNCNAKMSKIFESALSTELLKGYHATVELIQLSGPVLVFVWAALIFLKVHLKLKFVKQNLADPVDATMMSDQYDWAELHHLHTVARSFFSGAGLSPGILGTVLVLPARSINSDEVFDFAENRHAQTLYIRIGEAALFVVFNDAGMLKSLLASKLEKIDGPLTQLQLREVFCELCYLNFRLIGRPRFASWFDCKTGQTIIHVIHSEKPDLKEENRLLRGGLMMNALGHFLSKLEVRNFTPEELVQCVASGEFTFLFDSTGKFINEFSR